MPVWVECLLRILLAVGLGFALGVERQLRLKVAGIRTHAVVAAGACIFVLVSIYGFPDSDPARVAAQVVSGIGFIGAGMILHRQNAVTGLTSAAGIWLTAAIGMAAGAGMYIISSGATVLIIIVQLLLHIPCRLLMEKHYSEIQITFVSTDDECQQNIKKLFEVQKFTEYKASRMKENEEGEVVFNAVIHTKKQIDDEFIRQTLLDFPNIISIQRSNIDS